MKSLCPLYGTSDECCFENACQLLQKSNTFSMPKVLKVIKDFVYQLTTESGFEVIDFELSVRNPNFDENVYNVDGFGREGKLVLVMERVLEATANGQRKNQVAAGVNLEDRTMFYREKLIGRETTGKPFRNLALKHS